MLFHDYSLAAANAAGAIACLIVAYVFQDQVNHGNDANEYSAIIARIGNMGTQLAELNTFLSREKLRVAEAEATVKKLSDEKNKLEPVVLTQRQTVEAILSAHAQSVAKNVWKERSVGFLLGIGASLAASFVYEYLKR
jgi:hypothetical protein